MPAMGKLKLASWAKASITVGLFAIVVITSSIAISFGFLPWMMHVTPMATTPLVVLGIIAAICLVLGLLRLRSTLEDFEDPDKPEPARSDILYGRYLMGIGLALLIDAIVCSIVVVALAWITGRARLGLVTTTGDREIESNLVGDSFNAAPLDQLQSLGPAGSALNQLGTFFGNSADDAFFVAALFTFSTLVALLGALFFFATSVWSKLREGEREPFDRSIFWAGLWFRIGEAVLFNLVFFLLLRYYAPDQYLALPLVSLLVGMFLKAGEKLVSGLANRVFAAFGALVPTNLKSVTTLKLFTQLLDDLPQDETKCEEMLHELIKRLEAVRDRASHRGS